MGSTITRKSDKLSAARTALILLDVITDFEFEDGDLLLKHTRSMTPELARLADRARKARVPVIYVNDNFGKWQEDFKTMSDLFMRKDAKGHTVVEMLRPGPDDYYVLKPHRSAFYSTTLELLLRDLKARTLIITGITTDICVLFTANDAYMRGFDLYIPTDCVAAVKPSHTKQALGFIERVLKADTRMSTSIRFVQARKRNLAGR
jgi:nicotinamidase-related amidase